MPRKRVVVIGGGIVGLSCAWFLCRAGVDVTILEAADRTGAGASRGNAGAICPSMTQPLAGPDAVRAVLRDLGRPDAALHVHPSVMPRMAGFIRRFTQAATPAAFERGLLAMVALARGVTAAYDAMAEAGIGSSARLDGYLTLHATADGAASERAHIERMASLGACRPPGPILDGATVRAIEPLVSERVVAGFLLPGERWIDAGVLVDELTTSLAAAGVVIHTSCAVRRVVDLGDGIEIDAALGSVDADRVVVVGGRLDARARHAARYQAPVVPGQGVQLRGAAGPTARSRAASAGRARDAHALPRSPARRRHDGVRRDDGSLQPAAGSTPSFVRPLRSSARLISMTGRTNGSGRARSRPTVSRSSDRFPAIHAWWSRPGTTCSGSRLHLSPGSS